MLTDDERQRLRRMGGWCERWVFHSRYLTDGEVADACISELLTAREGRDQTRSTSILLDEYRQAELWSVTVPEETPEGRLYRDGVLVVRKDRADALINALEAKFEKWEALADELWEQCKHEAAMREEAEAAFAECKRRREHDREEVLKARERLEADDD